MFSYRFRLYQQTNIDILPAAPNKKRSHRSHNNNKHTTKNATLLSLPFFQMEILLCGENYRDESTRENLGIECSRKIESS